MNADLIARLRERWESAAPGGTKSTWILLSDLRAALAALERTCDTCTFQGHGWRHGAHYLKCTAHSLPCADLGNTCGNWGARPKYGRPL